MHPVFRQPPILRPSRALHTRYSSHSNLGQHAHTHHRSRRAASSSIFNDISFTTYTCIVPHLSMPHRSHVANFSFLGNTHKDTVTLLLLTFSHLLNYILIKYIFSTT